MTSVDGVSIDGVHRGPSGVFIHTNVQLDGGINTRTFPAEVSVSDRVRLSPHLGRPALFTISDAGIGIAELRGIYLR